MPETTRRRRRDGRLFTAWAVVVFIVLYVPIIGVLVASVNQNPANNLDWQGFTLEWFRQAWRDTDAIIAARNSGLIAITNALVAAVLGTSLALSVRRSRRLQIGAQVAAFLTLVVPVVVLGISNRIFYETFGPSRGPLTVVISHVVFNTAIVFLVVRARLGGIGRQIEEAAFDLGASRWAVLTQVMLPRLAPAIVAASLLAFTYSWDDPVIASFVRSETMFTLPTRILGSAQRLGLAPRYNAFAAVMLLISAGLIVVALLLLRRDQRNQA